MRCSKVRVLLSAMLDGELGRSEEEAVLRHIKACEPCKRELEELRKLRGFLGALPSEPLPLRVKMAFLSAIGVERAVGEMGCEEVRQAMHSLLDGILAEEVEGEVRAHLAVCRSCAHEFEGLRKGVELVRSLPKAEPPAWLLDPSRYVVERREAQRVPAWGRVGWPWAWSGRFAYALAVATAVLIGLAVFGVWREFGGGGEESVKVAVTRPMPAAPTSVVSKASVRSEVSAPTVKLIGKPSRKDVSEALTATGKEQERVKVERRPLAAPKPIEPTVVAQRRPVRRAPKAISEQKMRPRKVAIRVAPKEPSPKLVSSVVPVVKRLPEGSEARSIQKEEIRGPEEPTRAEVRPEPTLKEGEPKVEMALGKEAEGIEILEFAF